MTLTADGVPLNIGDSVWIASNTVWGEPKKAVCGSIEGRKMLYREPVDGYIGAKLTDVYSTEDGARTHWVEFAKRFPGLA